MRLNHLATAILVLVLAVTVSAPSLALPDSFEPCDGEQFGPDALCGTVTVLEDRAQSEGRTIDLRVVVLPATGEDTREPLFLLAGGPGQGATDLTELALGPFNPVRGSRDLILVDQRGTGLSNRIDCPVDAEASPQTVFGHLFDPDQFRECLEEIKQHADPTLYTTDHVVDDLDEVREQLGFEKVMLWGGSGGTRTALIWMRRHPKSVVGALLDGVAPSDFKAPSTMARGCQDTVDKMFAECRQQESCNAAYPNLEEDFATVLKLFGNGPVATHVVNRQGNTVPVEMHLGDFTYAVRGVMYRSRTLAKLPGLIHQAAKTGDIQPFAQMYWQRQAGIRAFVAMGVHFAIYCSEDMPFIAEEEVAGFTDDTFMERYLFDQYGGVCEFWEATPVPRSFLEPVQSDIPVLVISGYYDPSTPPSLGEAVASHLSNSRHIVVRDESHGAEFGCAREAAVRFMTTGSLEGLGPVCEDAGPVVYEVSP